MIILKRGEVAGTEILGAIASIYCRPKVEKHNSLCTCRRFLTLFCSGSLYSLSQKLGLRVEIETQ